MSRRKKSNRYEIPIRQATPADIEGISYVRGAVTENLQTWEELAKLGVTPQNFVESLGGDCRGWVAEDQGHIVAFAIADRDMGSLFALFVLPAYEGRGLGQRLLAIAVQWLWHQGLDLLWLITGSNTRAARFYQTAGWRHMGTDASGELLFERYRTAKPR